MRKFGILLAAGLVGGLAAGVAAQAQDIGIGLDIPLSAPGDAAGGQLIRRGAEIGIDTVNASGGVLGKKLKLFVTDSQSTPQMGVANYRRLVSEDKVVAVTGMFHSSVAIAINEVAKEMGVPTLAVQASASDITAKHYDIAFRTHAVDPVRVSAWMEFMKKKGVKKVSILAETTDYGIGLTDETIAQNKSGNFGFEIQKITFDNKSTDFTRAASAGQGVQARHGAEHRRRHAGRPDHGPGDDGRPAADDADADLLRCADPSAVLAAPSEERRGHLLHRLLLAEGAAVRPRQDLRRDLQGEVQGRSRVRRPERLRRDHDHRRGD